MNKGLKYKGQWGIVGIALFLTLSLIIASGSKPPCGEGDEICDQQWNLLEREESVSEHVTSNSQIIAADLNTQNIAEISLISTMNQLPMRCRILLPAMILPASSGCPQTISITIYSATG